MILFTGSGSIATAFQQQFDCRIISARSVSDASLLQEIANCKIVIHNAANIHPENLQQSVADNFLLTKRILDAVHSTDKHIRFYYISSMSMLRTHSEYEHTNMMSAYALGKYMGEQYCLHHAHPHTCSVRFSTICYNDPAKDGLSKLVWDAARHKKVHLINNGVATRDFIPVQVLVRYLHALVSNPIPSKKVNIVSGHPFSFRQVVEVIKHVQPDIEVLDQEMAVTTPVLSQFSKEDIQAIGEIDFRLEDEILAYYNSLIGENAYIQ